MQNICQKKRNIKTLKNNKSKINKSTQKQKGTYLATNLKMMESNYLQDFKNYWKMN